MGFANPALNGHFVEMFTIKWSPRYLEIKKNYNNNSERISLQIIQFPCGLIDKQFGVFSLVHYCDSMRNYIAV